MDKIEYEYTIAGLPVELCNVNTENANLNRMGADGWQLCAVYRDEIEGKKFKMHYFRRPKQKPLIVAPV
jgi:hypothetical protein